MLLSVSNVPLCSLEKLPFDDEEFDYVRMSRIGLGVPEDEVRLPFHIFRRNLTVFPQWQSLFEVKQPRYLCPI